MLHGVEASSAVHQLRNEGISFLYRGIFPPLAQRTISLSLMFGCYDGTRRPLVEHGVNPYAAKTIAGLAAGTVEAVLMPFERIQTLLADSTYHALFKNTIQAFGYVWTNHGFRELYRGITPILLRNGPSNSMFFVMREEASDRLPVRVSDYTIFYINIFIFCINSLDMWREVLMYMWTFTIGKRLQRFNANLLKGGAIIILAKTLNHFHLNRFKNEILCTLLVKEVW